MSQALFVRGGCELQRTIEQLDKQLVEIVSIEEDRNQEGQHASQVTLKLHCFQGLVLEGRSYKYFSSQSESNASAFASLLVPLDILSRIPSSSTSSRSSSPWRKD